MLLKLLHFKLFLLYYYTTGCIKYRVLPFNYFGVHWHHLKAGYTSKYYLNKFIPKNQRLHCILLDKKITRENKIKLIIKNFEFPILLKPEWGYFSHGVKKIDNIYQLKCSLNEISKKNINYLCQEFCNHKYEYDLFYIKRKDKIKILSITKVELPSVFGNGKDSLKILIKNSNLRNKSKFLKENDKNKNFIPKQKEEVFLSSKNSVLLGSKYSNQVELLEKNRVQFIKHVKKIKKFNINRISLKTNNVDDLISGNYKIFEMNVLFPGPISAFDDDLSIFDKNKIIKSTIHQIVELIKLNKVKISFSEFIRFYIKNLEYSKKIKKVSLSKCH